MDSIPLINQKLKQLISDKTGDNVKRFSEEIGVGQQRLNRLLSPDKRNGKFPSVNFEIIQAILKRYPEVDRHWLTGEKAGQSPNAVAVPHVEGDTLEIIKRQDGTEFRDLGEGRFLMVTPLIEQKAYAGYLSGWADPIYIEELPRHAVVVDKLHFGVYRSFEVKGDSMTNGMIGSYPDGTIVTCRQIERTKYSRSKLHLHDFQDYIIVQDDGIQLKRILSHDVEAGTIVCHSINEDKDVYPDFELHLDDVRELFNVVKKTENVGR